MCSAAEKLRSRFTRLVTALPLVVASHLGVTCLGCASDSPSARENEEPSEATPAATGASTIDDGSGGSPVDTAPTGGTGGIAAATGGSGTGSAPMLDPTKLPGCPAAPYEELSLENLTVESVTGGSWIEGPVWIAEEGALYYTHFGNQVITATEILRWDYEAGTGREWLGTTGAVALARDDIGDIYFTDYARMKIAKVNRETQERTDIADVPGSAPPNDLAVRSDGNIYFSTTYGGVRRVAPDGSVSGEYGSSSNGIALSPDGMTLYFTSYSGNVESRSLDVEGAVGAGSTFGTVTASTILDGMAVDCAGNIYVSYIMDNGGGGMHVFAPDGSTQGIIDAGGAVFNAAFGGPEKKTLFLTLRDNGVKSVKLNIPGLPY